MGKRVVLPWKLKEPSVPARVPKDFLDVARLNCSIKGYASTQDYLKALAKELRPTVEELRKRGLIKFEEDYFDKK